MPRVAVTGATGFIGSRLCEILERQGYEVTRIVRHAGQVSGHDEKIVVEQIDGDTNWRDLTNSNVCLIHLAALIHHKAEVSGDPQSEFWRSNVDGALNLAEHAAAVGIKRFIYISSVKVNGEATAGDPFHPEDEPAPLDMYGKSKLEAEKGLRKIAAKTGLEVVIIRPPLVYGPGVKANFHKLLKLVSLGIPLPFRMVRNKRSYIYLDNLTNFILNCISHPAAAGEIFLVSDGLDMDTPSLIRKMGEYMDRPIRLFPFSVNMLKIGGKIFGRSAEIEKICDSLQMDIAKAENLLDWKPPFSPEVGLKQTVAWFRKNV